MSYTESVKKTATILRKAADVMIKGGYVAGIRYGEDYPCSITGEYKPGAHCALGAIEVAANLGKYGAHEETPAVKALTKLLSDNPNGTFTIANWNNKIAKSAEKVACVMRATADFIEEEAGIVNTKEAKDGDTDKS